MASVPKPEIEIRRALAGDRSEILDVMYREPGPEMLGSCGGVAAARRFGAALLDQGGFPSSAKPIMVATASGRVVGMIQYAAGGSGAVGIGDTVQIARRAYGPVGALARIPAALARWRVELPVIEDEFYISEVHVDPDLRGAGIGGELLGWADREATKAGLSIMWLITGSDNPARRLYERNGYVVTAERHNARYQARTGISGRVRLQKTIAPAPLD